LIVLANPPKIETKVHRFLPLEDPRWGRFLQRHPRSSVFHTTEWLEALRRTYGYEPVALTTSPSGADLQNALVSCRVKSWLTGQRLVSLPFSDHCELLADTFEDVIVILSALSDELRQEDLQYAEIRPIHLPDPAVLEHISIRTCCLHKIDLRPDLDALFKACHKNSTQRKIRRAEREGLIYEEGRSPFLLDVFFDLLLLTRRRHMLPPQPKRWFQNLIQCFGETLKIRVAFKEKRPVAAILTLRFKDILVYKFGCSNSRFHNLGGMHFLLWRAICEAKEDGLRTFDLGRSAW
jgi:Acetyltransferase (GNAT) domain